MPCKSLHRRNGGLRRAVAGRHTGCLWNAAEAPGGPALPDEVLKASLAIHRDARLVEERLNGDPVSAKEDCVPVELHLQVYIPVDTNLSQGVTF